MSGHSSPVSELEEVDPSDVVESVELEDVYKLLKSLDKTVNRLDKNVIEQKELLTQHANRLDKVEEVSLEASDLSRDASSKALEVKIMVEKVKQRLIKNSVDIVGVADKPNDRSKKKKADDAADPDLRVKRVRQAKINKANKDSTDSAAGNSGAS